MATSFCSSIFFSLKFCETERAAEENGLFCKEKKRLMCCVDRTPSSDGLDKRLVKLNIHHEWTTIIDSSSLKQVKLEQLLAWPPAATSLTLEREHCYIKVIPVLITDYFSKSNLLCPINSLLQICNSVTRYSITVAHNVQLRHQYATLLSSDVFGNFRKLGEIKHF